MRVRKIRDVGCLMVQTKETVKVMSRGKRGHNLGLKLWASNRVAKAQGNCIEPISSAKAAVAQVRVKVQSIVA